MFRRQVQPPRRSVRTRDTVSMRTCQSRGRGHADDRTARQIVFLRVDVVFGEGEAHGSSTLKVTSPWV